MVMELSWLDHCLLWITLAATLVYPTVDSGLTITCHFFCHVENVLSAVTHSLFSNSGVYRNCNYK